METNDDELDKLIKETQDIWASLKNSGVELKDSQINDNENDISPNLNISNVNNTNITNEEDETSRTLQGLNLATPTNELSSFLMGAEPSKLSQIRFSTPNYKKTSNRINNFNQDDSTSIPDTPFVLSPTLPQQKFENMHLNEVKHEINADSTMNSNFTLSSPPQQIPPKEEEEKRQILQIDDTINNFTLSSPPREQKTESIDFGESCWNEINSLLTRTGFSMLMKQHSDEFEEVAPKFIICQRFREILSKYGEAKDKLSDCVHLKQQVNDLNAKNKELKQQLHISCEKMNDLKHELRQIKQEKIEIDESNEDLLINIKRQLEHSKNIISKKNEEINALKQRLQQNIEKEAVRRESVEAVFQSINKRNSRKNNKKDQQQLDIMQMYETERKKMQNELKFLRKEVRSLNQKLVEKSDYDGDEETDSLSLNQQKKNKKKKKRAKPSANISFTRSSRQQSEDEEESSDDDDDDDVVLDLKWKTKTKNEIKKQMNNLDDIERAKDLNRLESQKLREKLDEIYKEKEEIENNFIESKQKCKKLSAELEKRPSYNEWTRLRSELNEMNKKLMETQKVASLRKYMDTRELIKRDKEIHVLKLTDIDGLPVQIMKEILQDLCRILSINDVTILVQNVNKITKCVECVPVLEQYISKIVRILISSDHAPSLVKISKIAPKNIFDQVIPVLKEWVIDLDKVSALSTFRTKINVILKKRTIYKNESGDKENKMAAMNVQQQQQLALHEIVKQIEELVESEEYLLNSKQCFNKAQNSLNSKPEELCNRIIRHFQHIFSIKHIEGVFPKMNQIYLELNEMRNLIKSVKSILGLPQNCAINLCFKELQSALDGKEDGGNGVDVRKSVDVSNPTVITKWSGILMEIQKMLQCKDEDTIVVQCKELMDRCKEYDAVFPKIHNMVNQLRVTLNVEHAHQILPKVKELIGARC